MRVRATDIGKARGDIGCFNDEKDVIKKPVFSASAALSVDVNDRVCLTCIDSSQHVRTTGVAELTANVKGVLKGNLRGNQEAI